MLLKWGLKATVWVDENNLTLKVAGELVVTAAVVGGEESSNSSGTKRLTCDWAGNWATWQEMHDSADLAELKKRAEETLSRTGKGTKGWSKGSG